MGLDGGIEKALLMKKYITSHEIANEIRLKRQLHSGSFVIVEGYTDKKVFGNFFKEDICKLVPAFGKGNAVEALSILGSENFVGVVAIVDADFWLLNGVAPTSTNLFVTDTHDLETMMIQSPALEKVLQEFGSETKIQKFVKKTGIDVRTKLLDVGRVIGYFRWISLQENLDLKFDGLSYEKFVSRETLSIDVGKLIKVVKNHSQKHDLPEQEIYDKINELEKTLNVPLWHICCGDDLIYILSIGLRKIFGSRKVGEVKREILERSLRLAYEFVYFCKTKLYASLKAWEELNKAFEIVVSTNRIS